MTERWVECTRHSTGKKMHINMSHVGIIMETEDANGVTLTAIEVDQDYVNVTETISHFLPSEGGA